MSDVFALQRRLLHIADQIEQLGRTGIQQLSKVRWECPRGERTRHSVEQVPHRAHQAAETLRAFAQQMGAITPGGGSG